MIKHGFASVRQERSFYKSNSSKVKSHSKENVFSQFLEAYSLFW